VGRASARPSERLPFAGRLGRGSPALSVYRLFRKRASPIVVVQRVLWIFSYGLIQQSMPLSSSLRDAIGHNQLSVRMPVLGRVQLLAALLQIPGFLGSTWRPRVLFLPEQRWPRYMLAKRRRIAFYYLTKISLGSGQSLLRNSCTARSPVSSDLQDSVQS